MDKLIPQMYGNYGKYVNTFRSFPLIHDGLKPVERRVLLSVYDIARTSFTKSARVDGHCLIGNNIIKLADSTTQTIEKLYLDKVEDFYLFGFDLINNKPAICKADCVKLVKYVNKTIKITTESGCVECALDHKWLTKLGEYKKAEDFIIGDTLESMKFGITDEKAIKMANDYNNHTILKIEIIEYEDEIPLYDIINSNPHNNFAVMLSDNTSLISSNCIGHYHPHGTCITGDTRIVLLNGTEKTIKELSNYKDPFWVFSCKSNGDIVPGLAHSARITKQVNSLCKVTFDNDETLFCTEDHLVMLRDGNYQHAENLKKGISIMPLYLLLDGGYLYFRNNNHEYGIRTSEKVCHLVTRTLLNKDLDELIKSGYHVHHKDDNRSNDCPENLDLINKSEHASITGKNRSQESNKKMGEKIRKGYHNNPERKEKYLNGLKKGRQKMFSDNSPIRERIRDKNSKLISAYNKIQIKDKIIKIIKILIDEKFEINETNYEIVRKRFYNYPLWKNINKKFSSIDEVISIATHNHTIKSVDFIKLDTPIDVYDISVDKYHNFAISSGVFIHNSYGTLAGFARQGFLDPQGNFGNNIGVEESPPAAMRYTECRLSKWAHDLCFSLINYVERVESELDPEPAFLPVMFPICLLGSEYTTGIGFGYRTFIPLYNIKDLNKRLLWLLGVRKTEPIIQPLSDCMITSTQKELQELLTTGKASISIQGIVNVDNLACKAIIKSWPYGKRFQSILSKFQKELDVGDIGFADLSNEENGNYILFEVLKQRNRDKIFKNMIEKLASVLEGKLSFEMNMADENGQVNLWSVDDLLLKCFSNYKSILNVMLNTSINEVMKKIDENLTLQKIKPHLRTHMSDIIIDVESIYAAISKDSDVDEAKVKEMIQKYKISKLLTMDGDISGLKDKEIDFRNKLKNIDSHTLTIYQEFMKGF